MTGWGTGTECNNGCTGTVAEQVYTNTKITLASADTTFIETVGVSQGAKYTNMKMSSDNKVYYRQDQRSKNGLGLF
ncbi:hypothetical protein HYALB_00004058 [Hymenoscyphus albidus]|uniref:Uncharacterized protein n=1 Tax=Hymenoscyphus albidus TaxID=595503 RepID=A0A9N9M1A6_9HELO|nr:hypothetical protein HYALB_00004058 [Hymenoscyphus albidus]